MEEIEEAARTVGADVFIGRLADGFETEVGERGVQLSAGQRQLVAFARALLAEPRILILDEATSNVDVRTERVIERGLERLLLGRTAIVIAHRLSTIRRAGRIVVLEHGRIVESGTHDELIAAGGRVRAPLRGLGRAAGGVAGQLAALARRPAGADAARAAGAPASPPPPSVPPESSGAGAGAGAGATGAVGSTGAGSVGAAGTAEGSVGAAGAESSPLSPEPASGSPQSSKP